MGKEKKSATDVDKLLAALEGDLRFSWEELFELDIPDAKKTVLQRARILGIKERYIRPRVSPKRPPFDAVRDDIAFLFGLLGHLFGSIDARNETLRSANRVTGKLRAELDDAQSKCRELQEKIDGKDRRILLPGEF